MREADFPSTASPGPGRGSLRAELLFNLTFLALAAGLLAGTTVVVAQRVRPGNQWLLGALLLMDVVIYVLLANSLIVRLVLRPVRAAVETAQAVAEGDYARRAPQAESREMAALSGALNRMTDQLLENQEKLAHNVQSLDETNRRLLATTRDLVEAEKLASIGRLAAGVAHEIGNPLGALLGYAAVLRRRGADPELADGVEGEARRIDRIVRGLLDYARPAPPEREPVDVNAAARAAVNLLRVQGVMRDVDVQLQLADGLPPVLGSPHLLEQAFVNLVDNARQAMGGRGSITVSTRLERYQAPGSALPVRRADDPPGISYAHLRRQTVTSVRDPHRIEPGTETIRVTVADTGPGIPEENIDKVFDPFFTTRAPGEGTGLGLAIVASTVADFGGRIEASSGAGGGAVFTLSLPTRRPS
ncbi:sensor histidine kinase [Longimicrobium sp.]|uniref:sensor histidine kinase n=1 Tax=Longimicrobium sp. TaxID=2029185 RepID=UPI002E37C6DC|nr:ATP-binding protein [Longimicrobium sp.]HEX6037191.1 ATP-binding protein [Longimicrobium sp.]